MFELDRICFDGLAPVSMSLQAGELVGLSGQSGSGKSRLLRAIADMDEHSGDASLDGHSAGSMSAPEWRRQVAMLPAESQWWLDTVGEHFPGPDVDCSSLGFPADVANWEVGRCSSGEKQRLSILRCLANRPRVLLFDEATANLDPDNTIKVEKLVKQYLEDNGACCIWISHNRLQLQRIADRSFEIHEGECREVVSA